MRALLILVRPRASCESAARRPRSAYRLTAKPTCPASGTKPRAEHREGSRATALHGGGTEGVQRRLESHRSDEPLHLPRCAARQHVALSDADRSTPDKVIFLYEYMHNFRVVYTDGRGHRKNWEPSLLGDSIGRWDGDTLVIDTVNLTDRTWLDDHGDRHSDALHVIERWTRAEREHAALRGNDRRPEVLHEAVDRGLGHPARAERLGRHGIRLHGQQQGPVRRASAEWSARRIAARRHGDRQARAAAEIGHA